MARERPIFPSTFEELVKACVSFYEDNKDKMNSKSIREKRAKLADSVEVFHKECGTLTSSVKKRIKDLRNGIGIVLMTAHQPNFFAYSGVFRKATLNFVLAQKLESILKVPVVNFFGVADQDFTDDRWVRSCQLPAVQRSDGVFSIDVKLPENLMLNKVVKPSPDVLKKWKTEIEKWLDDTVRSVNRLCKILGLSNVCLSRSANDLGTNLEFFWSIVDNCYERSKRYSDFNAFMLSKIVNDVWGYDTVFARFSECQQIFVDEFSFLLSNYKDYSRLLIEAMEMSSKEDLSGGVSVQEPLLVPFWLHCDCGGKAKLFLVEEKKALFGRGNCVSCGKYHNLMFGPKNDPNISEVASLISARAISMCLVFFNGLVPSCYVGGLAGVEYLMEAEYVAKGLGILFPPAAVWRPHDKYYGIGQVEALLELKRICRNFGVQDLSAAKGLLESRVSQIRGRFDDLETEKKRILERLRKKPNSKKLEDEMKRLSVSQSELMKSSNLSVISRELKILDNVSTVFDLMPSIVDYAINIGLKETSSQWIQYLNKAGSLSTDVYFKSVPSEISQIIKSNNDSFAFTHKYPIHTD
jgi:hypothetical protein